MSVYVGIGESAAALALEKGECVQMIRSLFLQVGEMQETCSYLRSFAVDSMIFALFATDLAFLRRANELASQVPWFRKTILRQCRWIAVTEKALERLCGGPRFMRKAGIRAPAACDCPFASQFHPLPGKSSSQMLTAALPSG